MSLKPESSKTKGRGSSSRSSRNLGSRKTTDKELRQLIQLNGEKIINQLISKATDKGLSWAIELALAYGYGKPKQTVEQINHNHDYSHWTQEELDRFLSTSELPERRSSSLPLLEGKNN